MLESNEMKIKANDVIYCTEFYLHVRSLAQPLTIFLGLVGSWAVPEELLKDVDESLPILILSPENMENLDLLSIVDNHASIPNKRSHEMNHNEPLHSIHKKVYELAKAPENFVDKVVAFHLGHMSLSTSDLTDYFLHLDQTFAEFAYSVPAFRDLTVNDQRTLLLNNSPLYFQFHLAK